VVSRDDPASAEDADASTSQERRRIWLVPVIGAAIMVTAQMCAHFLHFPGVDWLVTAAAVVAVSIALAAGLTHEDLGLGRAGLRKGGRYALVIVVAVAIIVVVGVAIPPTRELFQNDAYRDLGHALLAAFIVIPFQTVLPEELFFRGVLLGSLRQLTTPVRALLIQAVLFGCWHVITSLGLTAGNAGLSDLFGHSVFAQAIGVAGAVGITAVSGVLFGWLRVRSDSLLAPIALHWAVNGIGAVGAALAWRFGG